MPTYEYVCRDCNQHLEVTQSFNDDPLTKCPNCGGELRKVFGNIGITFKGSGFYKTDNRSGSSASSAPASTSSNNTSSSNTSSSDTTSSEPSTKPSSGSSSGSTESAAS